MATQRSYSGRHCARVIGGLLVGADALGGRRLLPRDLLVDGEIGNAERLPVFEPDRIGEHERGSRVRIHEREAGREHAAGRMADDDGLADAERRQQRMRVRRELLERILIALGLGRLAPADLVGRDHAVAGCAQGPDRLFPGRRAEVLAMQDDGGPAVRRGRGRDVHVAHDEPFALRFEGEVMDRPGIGEALKLRAVSRRLGAGGKGAAENERGAKDQGKDRGKRKGTDRHASASTGGGSPTLSASGGRVSPTDPSNTGSMGRRRAASDSRADPSPAPI